MNQYPLWKYTLIALVLLACTLYALPNLYGEDPAIQISPPYAHNTVIDDSTQQRVEEVLKELKLTPRRIERTAAQLLLRFSDTEDQLKAYSALKNKLPNFVVAQNLAPAVPAWLTALGAKPMYLGLDLRGGVHFLMAIDMQTAIRQDEERFVQEFRGLLREENLRYKDVQRPQQGGVLVSYTDAAQRDKAAQLLSERYPDLVKKNIDSSDGLEV